MFTLSVPDPQRARSFLQDLVLPPPPRRRERGAGGEMSDTIAGASRALAVGSQFTEFASDVERSLRKDIINSFLVAQLAANALLAEVSQGPVADGAADLWYERYFLVLANSGWDVERAAEQSQDFAGSSAQVHQAILPILTAALGPAAATSTVVATLQSLAAASANRSWLTLFEKESRRASSNQFQVGYVRGAGGGPTRATLASFELDAQQSVTQVLFFRFADTRATLRYATSTLTLNEAVFRQVRDLVEERIRDHFAAFIASIEL
jgi:hypothetical protein